MTIADKIRNVRAHIPAGVTLVCVSKFQPVEAIREAYEAGERHFGESRVQELKYKVPLLPNDICWHFIGHLQTNKVRDLLRLFYAGGQTSSEEQTSSRKQTSSEEQNTRRKLLIHSVDSLKLLQAIDAEAAKLGVVQDVLLEVHIAREESKTGFLPDTIGLILDNTAGILLNVRICGLMTMATNTEDEKEIRRCFTGVRKLWEDMPVFSAGMSEDFGIAIECGSNMVRIGSAIFGDRPAKTEKAPTPIHALPKAVFFDQDGILFNSMPFHARAWEMAMKENNIPYAAIDCYRNEGRTGAGVIQEIYERLHGVEAPQELVETIYKTKSNLFLRLTGGKLPDTVPNVRDVLQYLHSKGVACWVVTGSGQHNLIDALNDTFDHVFSGVISSFDVKHGKPDPEPYLKAWTRSGFRKEECMVVENAPLGVRAAKAAELFTCAVNTGPLPDSDLAAEGADRIFPDMQALLEWLISLSDTNGNDR